MPHIVATAALGKGIDMPGITYVLHLEAPHSIIDYTQEAGASRRGGERAIATTIAEDKDWPVEDLEKEGGIEMKYGR